MSVDHTLIDEMLRLSPADRLRQNDHAAALATRVQAAFLGRGRALAEARALTSILDALLEHQVDFVLVGTLAAVVQGAPVTTHDVDIVPARTPANLDRVMAALFATDLGPLDCLGAIERGMTFDDLIPLSIELDLDGRMLRALGLETLVELKRSSTAPKDRLVLIVLEETLRRRARSG